MYICVQYILKINIINCTLNVHLCSIYLENKHDKLYIKYILIYRTLWLHNYDDDDIPTETAIGELYEYRLGNSGRARESNGKEERELEAVDRGSSASKKQKDDKQDQNQQTGS